MKPASDAAFVAACKESGLSVGIESGLLLLAIRKVFEAGVRHQAYRHMSTLWAAHEGLDQRPSMGLDDELDMLLIRAHIEKIREEYLS